MNEFDDWLNDLTDDDELWGALSFLRPEPTARFTPQRTLAIALLHGVLWGMFGNVVFALLAMVHGTRVPPLAVLPGIYVLVIYVALAATLVRAWNRRATHLARQADLRGGSNDRRFRGMTEE
jgi:hypothetical protein